MTLLMVITHFLILLLTKLLTNFDETKFVFVVTLYYAISALAPKLPKYTLHYIHFTLRCVCLICLFDCWGRGHLGHSTLLCHRLFYSYYIIFFIIIILITFRALQSNFVLCVCRSFGCCCCCCCCCYFF